MSLRHATVERSDWNRGKVRLIAFWLATFVIVFELAAGSVWNLMTIEWVEVHPENYVERGGKFYYPGDEGEIEVFQEFGKIGKSLKNSVSPDEICDGYGCTEVTSTVPPMRSMTIRTMASPIPVPSTSSPLSRWKRSCPRSCSR